MHQLSPQQMDRRRLFCQFSGHLMPCSSCLHSKWVEDVCAAYCSGWHTCLSSVLLCGLPHLVWSTCSWCGTLHKCPVLSCPTPWVSILPMGKRVVPSGCLLSFSMASWLPASALVWLLSCHSDDCDTVVLESFCGRRVHAAHVRQLPFHKYVWGSQALHPSLWATAILTASSDCLNPTQLLVMHAATLPECGNWRCCCKQPGMSTVLCALGRMADWWFVATIPSSACWMWCMLYFCSWFWWVSQICLWRFGRLNGLVTECMNAVR